MSFADTRVKYIYRENQGATCRSQRLGAKG